MSIISRDLWFVTPLQAAGVLLNAANLGASAGQSPLTIPLLLLDSVPAKHAAEQMTLLLRRNEKLLPVANAIAMLDNLIVGVTCLIHRNHDAIAKAKYPYALSGFFLNVCVTVYAFAVMVPLNKKIQEAARDLQANPSKESSAWEFRQWTARWRKLNWGRAVCIFAAAVAGTMGILQDCSGT